MEREVQQLDDYSKKLLTPDGFIDRFFEMKHYYLKNIDAYEAVERQYKTLTGVRRYNSFESFKTSCSRKYKKRRLDSQKK